jgi:hypothetical protein
LLLLYLHICSLSHHLPPPPGSGNRAEVSVGREYRDEVEQKIAKWTAPLPPRQIKALPVPKTGEGKTVKVRIIFVGILFVFFV